MNAKMLNWTEFRWLTWALQNFALLYVEVQSEYRNSTIKRRLYQCKCRGFTTNANRCCVSKTGRPDYGLPKHMTAKRSGYCLFSDDVAADKINRMNSEVLGQNYLLRFCQMLNSAKIHWTLHHSADREWPEAYYESNPRLFEGKKRNFLLWPS